MEYTTRCVGVDGQWKYRVTLWCGKVPYNGDRIYARLQDAEKAARRTGATPRDEAK